MADDMARRALEEKGEVIFWGGDVPEDAPANQVAEVYEQQEVPNQLDWTDLPDPIKLVDPQPEAPSVACVFGRQMATWAG